MNEETMGDVAAFYNERARIDPSNPPGRREVADEFGISPSTAQKWLEVLDDRRQHGIEPCVVFPIRRRRLRGKPRG